MKTDVVQKAIISNNDGDILLLRRSDTDTRRPLQWDPPGGLFEENEILHESIAREVLEETGLTITGPRLCYATTEIRTWIDEAKVSHTKNVVFIYYTAHSNSSEIKLSFEHDKHQWVSLEKAIELIDYEVQNKALKHIRDNSLLG